MENFARSLRPSAVPSARVSALAVASAAQLCTLGRPAVEIQVRTAPLFLLPANWDAAVKINNETTHNYNGTTSAMGEGMATSIAYGQQDSAARVQTAQVDKAKGGNARGIPPRGRPV